MSSEFRPSHFGNVRTALDNARTEESRALCEVRDNYNRTVSAIQDGCTHIVLRSNISRDSAYCLACDKKVTPLVDYPEAMAI